MVIEVILLNYFDENLWLLKVGVYKVPLILNKILVFIQLFEFLAMTYIIKSQENRKIEEILFQHNNEPISTPLNNNLFERNAPSLE